MEIATIITKQFWDGVNIYWYICGISIPVCAVGEVGSV